MSLSVVSLNYKTTPVEVREQLAVSVEPSRELLEEIRRECHIPELMVLSTCNRVEFYFPDDGAGDGRGDNASALLAWLQNRHARQGTDEADLERAAVTLKQRAALTHLFRVACSLESMVVGEPQILGQVKEAFQASVAHGFHGKLLAGLMPRVFRAAKRVRSETQVARFPVSVSFVAVQLASKIFESLEDKTVMVVGSVDWGRDNS